MIRSSISILFIFFNTIVLYGQIENIKEKSVTKFDYNRVFRTLAGVNSLNSYSLSSVEDKLESFKERLWTTILDDVKQSNGRFEMGYSYGLNTVFTDTSRGISSIFNTSGAMQTGLFGLPVEFSFNYSTLRHPLGANNYFRVSFDKERYLEKQKSKINEQIAKVNNLGGEIDKKQFELSKVQGYTEVFLDMLKRKIQRESEGLKDTLLTNQVSRLEDSTNISSEDLNGALDYYNSSLTYQDSLQQIMDDRKSQLSSYQKEYDSIKGLYEKTVSIQESYDSLKLVYDSYKNNLSSYETEVKEADLMELGTSQFSKLDFVKSIRKIDLGLTYPQTTALSTQTTPIKGIGTEFQYNQFYLAVSSGMTLNNMMISTNEITNQLEYNQNVFNQFDFQEVKDNGLLTTLKTGWGSPEETHAFLGFNYLTNTRFLGVDNSAYDPAAAFEIDLRYVPEFYQGGSLDVVYGKTSANSQIDSLNELGVFNSLFSNYSSSVFLSKYTQKIDAVRSEFSIQFRNIDPFANTTVYGLMQPGNRRYAFESRHRIASYLKVGTTYRRDESYGNPSYLYKLNTVGVNASGSYTDYLSYSAMLNYVSYSYRRPVSEVDRGNNYLAGINLQSNYTGKGLKWITGITYNDYLFSDTIKAVKYTQLGISHGGGNKKWKAFMKYDYFYQSSAEFRTGTHLFSVGGSYSIERFEFDAGITFASENDQTNQIGGYVDVIHQLNKWVDISFRAERFVMGGFYRNYYRTLYERFPYMFSINLRLNF